MTDNSGIRTDIKSDCDAGMVEENQIVKVEANWVFNTLVLSTGNEWVMFKVRNGVMVMIFAETGFSFLLLKMCLLSLKKILSQIHDALPFFY